VSSRELITRHPTLAQTYNIYRDITLYIIGSTAAVLVRNITPELPELAAGELLYSLRSEDDRSYNDTLATDGGAERRFGSGKAPLWVSGNRGRVGTFPLAATSAHTKRC